MLLLTQKFIVSSVRHGMLPRILPMRPHTHIHQITPEKKALYKSTFLYLYNPTTPLDIHLLYRTIISISHISSFSHNFCLSLSLSFSSSSSLSFYRYTHTLVVAMHQYTSSDSGALRTSLTLLLLFSSLRYTDTLLSALRIAISSYRWINR